MANSLIKSWVLPQPALRPFIDRYWCASGVRGSPLPTLLPGTGVDLYIHQGLPFSVAEDQQSPYPAPQAHLNYMRAAPLQLLADSDYSFVVARFRSGALRHFCPELPECGIADPIAMTSIWGGEAERLTAQLMTATSLAACAPILDRWLLARLEHHQRVDRLIDHAAMYLYYHHANGRIEALVDHYDLGRRQFERRFKNALGCSPKIYLRVARFQSTMRELLLHQGQRYTDTALAHGYFDQAHFIHDFRHYVPLSPRQFLQQQAGGSHFYNPHLPREI
jgi:AraC-like DNA-binding protein